MSQQPLRLLVTGAGAPGIRGTLYALRHNPDQVPVYTVGIDIKAEAVGRYFMDAFYQVPHPETDDYLESLIAICEQERINIILPQTTREIVTLSHHQAALREAGFPVMVADAPAIQTANNKLKLLQCFVELDLPHPDFRLARSEQELVEAAAALGYPQRRVVVKPPVSNGMRGFRILHPASWDLDRFLTEKPNGEEIALEELLGILQRGAPWPELLVSEYLPGPEYSVDGFIGTHFRVAVPRLRRAIRSGISFDNRLDSRQDIVDLTLQAAEHIGLRYAFGFQFKLDAAGVPKVLESNPRIQGTMVASLFGGANIIWLGVQEVLGRPPRGLPGPLQPAAFYRYWGGVGVQGEHVDEI